MSHDLQVAGTSLLTLAVIEDFSEVFNGAPVRGDDLTVPNRAGQVGTAKVRDAYTFSVPLTILGATPGAFHDALDSLRALCDTAVGTKTLTRTKPAGAGDRSDTCLAKLELIEGQMFPDGANGRAILSAKNLDGCWYGSTETFTVGTGTVKGTGRTSRITLILPSAGTLTNTTLGVSVTVTAGATLTVEAKTSTGLLSDVVAAGDPLLNWFALGAGSNTVTWSGGGSPTISYAPAYL